MKKYYGYVISWSGATKGDREGNNWQALVARLREYGTGWKIVVKTKGNNELLYSGIIRK